MLQAIHDRVTGWVAWIIVALIGVTFALWGIDWYLKKDTQLYAARVNNVEIPVNEFRRAFQERKDRIRAAQGASFDPDSIDEEALRKQVLDNLVDEELLSQTASEYGFAVSDALLAARIHAVPDFNLDGEFSVDRYQSLLARQGLSTAAFEHRMRRSLLIGQLMSGVMGTVPVSDSVVDASVRLLEQQREFEYMKVPLQRFLDKVQVTDEEAQDWFEAHRDRFIEPEAVKLAYVEMQLADVGKDIVVDDKEIAEVYEQQKQRFGKEEERRARHILISVAEDAPEDEVAAALQRAKDIIARLDAGEKFEDLARENSDDQGSASEGGDLGFFGKGLMVKPFEDAAYSLEAGQRSEPIRSPFGFHIIEVTEIRAGETPPLEEVSDRIRAELVDEKAKSLFFDRLEELAQASFENPDTLAVAAETLQLEVEQSDWITRKGSSDGIGVYPQVLDAAFSEDVRDAGNNSEVIEVEPNHVLVIRVEESRPSRQKEFSEVRVGVEQDLLAKRGAGAARELGERLAGQLKDDGANLKALAAANELELVTPGFVTRSAANVDPQILNEAFRLPAPATGKPSIAGFALPTSDYVVLAVTGIRDGDPAQIPAEKRELFRTELRQLYGQSEAKAFIDDLKSRAEIEVHLDDL